MKKYCLTRNAKESIGGIFIVIAIVCVVVITVMWFMYTVSTYIDSSKLSFNEVMFSFMGQFIMFPYLAIRLKRWLQNNIEEC